MLQCIGRVHFNKIKIAIYLHAAVRKNIFFNYLIASLLIASTCLTFSYFYCLPWLKKNHAENANLIFILFSIQALPYFFSISIYYAFIHKSYHKGKEFYKNILQPLLFYLFLIGITVYLQYFASNHLIHNSIEKKLASQELNYHISKSKIKRLKEIQKFYESKSPQALQQAERFLIAQSQQFPEDIAIDKLLLKVQIALTKINDSFLSPPTNISRLEIKAVEAMNSQDFVLAKNIYQELLNIYPDKIAYAAKRTLYANKLEIADKKSIRPSLNLNEIEIAKNNFNNKINEIDKFIIASTSATNTPSQRMQVKQHAYLAAKKLYLLNQTKPQAKERYEKLYLDLKTHSLYFPEYQQFKNYVKPVYIFTNIKYAIKRSSKEEAKFYLQADRLYLTRLDSAFIEGIRWSSATISNNINTSVSYQTADYGKIESNNIFLNKISKQVNNLDVSSYHQLPNYQLAKQLKYLPVIFSQDNILIPLVGAFYLWKMKSFIKDNLSLSPYFLNILILYKLALPIFLCIIFLNFFYLSWQEGGKVLYPHSILYIFLKLFIYLFLYVSSIYFFAFLSEAFPHLQILFIISFLCSVATGLSFC